MTWRFRNRGIAKIGHNLKLSFFWDLIQSLPVPQKEGCLKKELGMIGVSATSNFLPPKPQKMHKCSFVMPHNKNRVAHFGIARW